MQPIVRHLRTEFQKLAKPENAGPMQAYMKTQQPFYGIKTPERRALVKAALKQFPVQDFDAYIAIVRELWQGRHREEQYAAIDIAGMCKAFRTLEAFPLYEEMLQSAENWDLVDGVAASLVGNLVAQHRELEADLQRWLQSDNFWMRRSALLAHLKHKQDTNVELLAATIRRLMHEKEFFIRKAIGWSLREYARTDPDWVRRFVKQHEQELSGLSKREALKHIA